MEAPYRLVSLLSRHADASMFGLLGRLENVIPWTDVFLRRYWLSENISLVLASSCRFQKHIYSIGEEGVDDGVSRGR